ncbi:uncharacterized protein LOC126555091 [Aphis gossypii]|uniref:uncharacterized protein LOC126555091 n=1 Tax=Aphis gossypii TaxID=80765 RepID=UPI0021598FAA|nr:uncharacterized protein LOC126555091 [Aphis gossypii]
MSCYSLKAMTRSRLYFPKIILQQHLKKRYIEKVSCKTGEETSIEKDEKEHCYLLYRQNIRFNNRSNYTNRCREHLEYKKDDCSLTVKTPVDNTAVDYWTIAHYKCAKIDKVALQDRWKHAECSLKISLTGQHPDDLTTAKKMVTLIQSVFDKMMRHPAKKLIRHKPKKINL